MPTPDDSIVGWDVGGAHVKACLMRGGEVVDVAQWACPLWQGIGELERVLRLARERWPGSGAARHAVTMTGEMVDLFESRADGVRRIAASMVQSLVPARPAALRFFAGELGWCRGDEVVAQSDSVASANWFATTRHAAERFDAGVVVDIGSTTTDLIAFRGGRVRSGSRTDADRLASGELVYHGVVRTPLCAVAPRIAWRGATLNVMNEFFASAADVYRLTGELNPAHDQYPSADAATKDLPATRQRLARMIGLDRRDANDAEWQVFAQAWRAAQVAELGGQLRRVLAAHRIDAGAVVVSAGCGDFLVADVVAHAVGREGMRLAAYGRDVARVAAQPAAGNEALVAWAQVCAPCVAVATLFDREQR